VGQAAMRIVPKDVTNPTAPSSNNAVTINRYHVSYTRSDGRNTQGVDVPYAFDGVLTATITSSSTVAFELVRTVAKHEPPLAQLISNPQVITMFAQVTFYGRDLVGNDVSVTGNIQINFGDFAQ
jgi:hypothetical protein